MPRLTEEQIAEYKEAFLLLDKDGSGRIPSSQLGVLVRSLGSYCSEEYVAGLLAELDPDGNGFLDFHDFVFAMHRQYILSDARREDEIWAALRAVGKGPDDAVSPGELRVVLQRSLGESLTDEEVD